MQSETEEMIYRPISVHQEQRFGRFAVGIGGGFGGSVSSACIFSINELRMMIFSGG